MVLTLRTLDHSRTETASERHLKYRSFALSAGGALCMLVDTYGCGALPVFEYFHAVSHILIFTGTYPVSIITFSVLNRSMKMCDILSISCISFVLAGYFNIIPQY